MTFALEPGEMAAASAAVTDASSEARTADGADALATLAAALPGSATAAYLPDLGGLWEAGISDWCDRLDDFRAGLDGTTSSSTAADGGAGSVFEQLLGGS